MNHISYMINSAIVMLVQNNEIKLTKQQWFTISLLNKDINSICIIRRKLFLVHYQLKIEILFISLSQQTDLFTVPICYYSVIPSNNNSGNNSNTDIISSDSFAKRIEQNDEYSIDNQLVNMGYEQTGKKLCIYEIYNTDIINNFIGNMIKNRLLKIKIFDDSIKLDFITENEDFNINSHRSEEIAVICGSRNNDNNNNFLSNYLINSNFLYRKRLFHFYELQEKKYVVDYDSDDLGDYDLSKYNSDNSYSESNDDMENDESEDDKYDDFNEDDYEYNLFRQQHRFTPPDIVHVSKRVKIY